MLPAIGLMVGATGGMIAFYIMARMGHLLEDEEASTGLKVFAVITVIAAVVGLIFLIMMSADLIITSESRGPVGGIAEPIEVLPEPEDSGDVAAEVSGALTLQPKNETGIAGVAYTERAMGDSVIVVLELERLDEGVKYPAGIYHGTCANGGSVAARLSPVEGQRSGSGTSRSNLGTGQFTDTSSYHIQVQLPDGTVASCANIPTG